MDDKYFRQEFTVRLEYTLRIPEDEEYTTTVVADNEEAAIEKAWDEMYERTGYDVDCADENDAVVTKRKTIPGRGCEDDQTLEMFPGKK